MAVNWQGCGGRGWFPKVKEIAVARKREIPHRRLWWLCLSPTSKQKVRKNVMLTETKV